MLRTLKYFFIKLKLLKPSVKDIAAWKHNYEVLKIEYVLLHGNYKIREIAADALGELNQESSIPVLMQFINDDIQKVSIAALNALDKIDYEDQLSKSLINKRFNWAKIQREKEEKAKTSKDKKYNIYRWERASKKSFERVKEQLKRPMR